MFPIGDGVSYDWPFWAKALASGTLHSGLPSRLIHGWMLWQERMKAMYRSTSLPSFQPAHSQGPTRPPDNEPCRPEGGPGGRQGLRLGRYVCRACRTLGKGRAGRKKMREPPRNPQPPGLERRREGAGWPARDALPLALFRPKHGIQLVRRHVRLSRPFARSSPPCFDAARVFWTPRLRAEPGVEGRVLLRVRSNCGGWISCRREQSPQELQSSVISHGCRLFWLK